MKSSFDQRKSHLADLSTSGVRIQKNESGGLSRGCSDNSGRRISSYPSKGYETVGPMRIGVGIGASDSLDINVYQALGSVDVKALPEPLRSARYELEAASANLACERCRFPVRQRDLAYAEKRAKRAIANYAEAEQRLEDTRKRPIVSRGVRRLSVGTMTAEQREGRYPGLPYAIGAALACGFIIGGLL